MCPTPALAPSLDFSLAFPPDPVWVRTCRETIRTFTRTLKAPELTELAVLLTSESVTNAITACAGGGCAHAITLHGEWRREGSLRIHVRDAAPGVPAVHSPAPDAVHGRGMHLIATCAARWGICLDGPGPGKSVWFQLDEPANPRGGSGGSVVRGPHRVAV
ncbi:ATP-binding protein [Streptomyces sp. NPDC050610]|uniref:ATP-binding protein n=1 Tax=Streptomyces sp. NPDC050610 TaxID=3157097 RepID=UPI00341DF680